MKLLYLIIHRAERDELVGAQVYVDEIYMQTSDRARLFNPVWIFDFNFIEKQICLMLNSIFYGGFLNLDCDLFLLKNRIAIKVNLLVK